VRRAPPGRAIAIEAANRAARAGTSVAPWAPMIRRAPLALVFLSLAACHEPPIATSPTNNENLVVEQLFTHEGCTVYRFYDGGAHYYVRCKGEPPATLNRVGCGKNCTRTEEIPTIEAAR
jgi:hypothetical protein